MARASSRSGSEKTVGPRTETQKYLAAVSCSTIGHNCNYKYYPAEFPLPVALVLLDVAVACVATVARCNRSKIGAHADRGGRRHFDAVVGVHGETGGRHGVDGLPVGAHAGDHPLFRLEADELPRR